LAALLVGAGAGVAVGITAGSNTTTRVKSVTAPAQTVIQTAAGPTKSITQQTVTGPTRTVTRTRTLQRTVQVATPAPNVPAANEASAGGGTTFTGNGYQNLGTVEVPSDSTLTWQCSCSSMEITSDPNSDGNNISVSSNASSGQTTSSPAPATTSR
jgi:hypothetical protein